jgi:hypothetical protein
MGRSKLSHQKIDTSRDAGGFIALPWTVIDCAAYKNLSHPAKSLLLEIARQYRGTNNGKLIVTYAYLRTRGWTSSDTITRAKRELLNSGFIHETFKGHRPNKASWFALTFHSLFALPGFDVGAMETFKRGAYRQNEVLIPTIGVRRKYKTP